MRLVIELNGLIVSQHDVERVCNAVRVAMPGMTIKWSVEPTDGRTSELLSLARMARKLGVAAKWLRSVAESGAVPHLSAGGRLLFHPPSVVAAVLKMASEGDNPCDS